MSAPRNVYNIPWVTVRSDGGITNTSELNPRQSLVTGCCEAKWPGYWAEARVTWTSAPKYSSSWRWTLFM